MRFMKKSLPASISLLFLLFVGVVSAQGTDVSSPTKVPVPTTPGAKIQEKRAEVRDPSTSSGQEKRMTVRENITKKREELKERIAEKRLEASEAAATRRVEFKEKVAQIRDTKKRAIVEKVDLRLSTINQKRTDHMSEFLVRLSTILDKIESRKDKAIANGKDVTEVESAIADARSVIEAAKTQVAAQAGKDYTIELSEDETTLRGVVGDATSSLQRDLQNTRKVVVEAKQAVQNVMSIIKQIGGVDSVQ